MSYDEDLTNTVWVKHTFDSNKAADIVWDALEEAGHDRSSLDDEVVNAFNNLMMALFTNSRYVIDDGDDDPWA